MLNRALYLTLSYPDSALNINREIVHISRVQGYNFGIAGAYYQIGKTFAYGGQHDSATFYFRKAFGYLTDPNTLRLLMPALYNGLGHIHEKDGDFELAADMYIKSALIADQVGYDAERYYSNLALVLMRLKRYDQALYHLGHAEEKITHRTDPEVKGAILVNKGLIYAQKGEQEKALPYLMHALAHGRSQGLSSIQHTALLNMASIQLRGKRATEALPLLRQTLQLEDNPSPVYLNATWRKLGETFIQLQAYDSADHYLLKALEMAHQRNIAIGRLECYLLLAQRHEQTGDYKQAYAYQDRYLTLQDSLTGIESGSSLNRLEVKYRTAQKEKENAEHKLLISTQQERLLRVHMALWGAGILLVVITTAFILIYRYHRKLQQEKIQRLRQQEAVNILQAVMHGEEKERNRLARELHDGIGGMLASVKMHIAAIGKQHPQTGLTQAINMIDDTAHEVRKTSHNLMPEQLYRYGLVKATQLFCNTLAKSSGQRIDFQSIGVMEQLNRNFELSLYRMIQELVQNVLKHASAAYTLVQISCHDQHLSILVEDNGVGMSGAHKADGMGLSGIQSRTALMNGNFTLESTPGVGTTICIDFDLMNVNSYFR